MLHGAGPAVVTDKTNPLTSVQVRRSAAPVIGLVPTSPVTAEVGTSVMPASVRITKSPAVRRFTGAGPGPAANALPATARRAIPAKYLFLIMLKRVGECLRLALGNVAHLASNCDACAAHASLCPRRAQSQRCRAAAREVPEAGPRRLLRRVYEAALSFFRFAEVGDYGEVFEGSGVAFDFAVGGQLS